ncbi:MAG: DNA methyltransferase, partial [Armatimonadota bacterium]
NSDAGAVGRYFCRLAPPPGHDELARLEFEALTADRAPEATFRDERKEPADTPRLAWARAGVDVGRAAYVATCCRLLARGDTLEDLLARAEKLRLRLERFRIRARKAKGVPAPDSPEIERAVADTITGSPDLSRPAVELLVWVHPDGWLLGGVVSRTTRGWQGHEQRPFQYSCALPPQIARALVNLVAAPGDRIIDPCCGSGTVLVEAGYMGVEPFGWEINQTVGEQAAANVCHHGQAAWLTVGDGRNARGSWDGAVLDLPYGISNDRVEDVSRGLVAHALEVARLVAIVTVGELEDFLGAQGAKVLGTATIVKNSLRRRVYWAKSSREPGIVKREPGTAADRH